MNFLQPPPIAQFRKGTRTRPHVKVPKYYHDYDDILTPSQMLRQEDPIIPAEKIKAEPIDFVENDLNYDVEMDNSRGNGNEDEDIHEDEEDDEKGDKDDFLKITLMKKDSNSEKFAVLEIEERVDVDDSDEMKTAKKMERTSIEEEDDGKFSEEEVSVAKLKTEAKKVAEEKDVTKELKDIPGETETKKVAEEKELAMPVLSPIQGIKVAMDVEEIEEKACETVKGANELENLSDTHCKNEENN